MKIWLSGNTLVELWGEEEVKEELEGKGYQSQLTSFILKRDKAIAEEDAARAARAAKRRMAAARSVKKVHHSSEQSQGEELEC